MPLGPYSHYPALIRTIPSWWRVEQVYPGRTFDKYGVIGDVVIITFSGSGYNKEGKIMCYATLDICRFNSTYH